MTLRKQYSLFERITKISWRSAFLSFPPSFFDRYVEPNVLEMFLCVCVRGRNICLFVCRKQREQIKPFIFISGSLYPLASLFPSSQHQLMCVILKSNLYHLNESKAPQQNGGSPISTHQLLLLKSPIVWVRLWWLVGILMWCRLPDAGL